MIDKVTGNRIGVDNNKYLIALLKAVQQGWIPPSNISREEYNKVKDNPDSYEDYYVGFVGFCCSYAVKWFGGYANSVTKAGRIRNYCFENKENLLAQAPKLKDVDFRCCSYDQLDIPKQSIIYCEYANSTKYVSAFDHISFWRWCREKCAEGHALYVSEYSAPEDFVCTWSKQVIVGLDVTTTTKRIERLFVHESQLNLHLDNRLF